MNILIWLVVGGVIGWMASWVLETHNAQDLMLNVAVGTSGAMLGGWFLTPFVGSGTFHPGEFSSTAVAVSLIGAAMLIAIFNMLRSDAVH